MIMVSIVNQSSVLRGRNLLPIVQALATQLFRDVSPFYGEVPGIELGTPDEHTGDAIISILDNPDVADALGYHDQESGIVYGKVFAGTIINNGGSLQDGPNSVSATLSHELLEMVGDENANKWSDNYEDGKTYAYELCDAVENDSYEIDGISVSNFVYPEFFDAQSTNHVDVKLDHLGLLDKPFSMTSGGYQIVRNSNGVISQVWGKEYPEWKKITKEHKLLIRGLRMKDVANHSPSVF